MPTISFTDNIQRHINCPTIKTPGSTVREALEYLFTNENPRARGYVLDDQGALRKHMNIFIDGSPIKDTNNLSDAVTADTEIYIMQALSGG